MIVIALILLAGFAAAAPYVSSALKQGFSLLSSLTTGLGTTSSNTLTTPTTPAFTGTHTVNVTCAGVISVGSPAAPDIKNGTAKIIYPSDYCTLAAYALTVINEDRAANGTGPVSLDYNQAAQQHADSMMYYNYFSHFDTQGLKPYMRYTLLGGVASDFENVAFLSYSIDHFTNTQAVKDAIKTLEHSMVYNDTQCCNNGHRYNILDHLRNKVSIGITYDTTHVYFDEEFENNYVDLNFNATKASSSNPYYVTMTGVPTQPVPSPSAIYIAYDGTPTAETVSQLNGGPHEYGPGQLIGGILPQNGLLGNCGQFASGITVCADRWSFKSTGMDIEFPMKEFVKNYGPGVYSIYLIVGSDTNSAITTISVFVP
jgi:uncharacterized protein YkwD